MKKHTILASVFLLSSAFFNLYAQTGTISTIAGNGYGAPATGGYSGDGAAATNAELFNLDGVAVDVAGNVYIADQLNNRIRKVATTGIITTFAGNGVAAYSGNNGQATAAEISNPTGIRVDTLGNVYFSDAGNGLIRKIATTGIITTIAGRPGIGSYSGDGGQATAAEINFPVGLGIDKNLNIYIADQNNNVIRKIATTGIITTVAGNYLFGAGFSGDGGTATSAELYSPTGVAVDKSGNMYIADYQNNAIRVVNTSGTINTFAGNEVAGFNGLSGLADTIQLYNPTGVSTDKAGNVYISDAGNALIREVYISSNQTYTIAGQVQIDGYSGDGGPALDAELFYPFDVVTDANNNAYIADEVNNRVREVSVNCSGDTTTASVVTNLGCANSSNGIVQAVSNSAFVPYTYTWNTGASTMQVSGLSAGSYTVILTDANGCAIAGTVVLTAPPALIASTGNDSICAGHDVQISSSASGGVMPYTFMWQTGWVFDTLTVSPASLTQYTIYVHDNNGCSDSAVSIVSVNALPVVSFVPASNTVCSTENLDSLVGTPAGGTFSGPGVIGNNFNATLLALGTYAVTYTYTDSVHCTDSIQDSITVTVCSGIQTVLKGGQITVYPNPANDMVNVVLADNENTALISLYSLTGEKMFETIPNNNQTIAIPVSQLSAGIYFLKATMTDGSVMMQKVEVAR